jgi:arylsulfatase
VKDGKSAYEYNWLGLKRNRIVAAKPLPPGKATVQFDFLYDGGGIGKGGTGRILVNGEEVAEGRIDQTQCCLIALDETADVGMQTGTPSSEDYIIPFAFTGTIDRVVVDLTPGADASSNDARAAADAAKVKRATIEE